MIDTLFSLLLRLLLLVLGFLLAAGVAALLGVMAVVWLLRATWARLTGRPVRPFAARMRAGPGFGRAWRRAPEAPPAESRFSNRADRVPDGVTDVLPK